MKLSKKNSLKNIIKENELINNNNNNNNNNIYKKIDNLDSYKNNNNHINHILNNKNKDKNLQKNLFLNNKINKFNHVNRIINLKSLNDHYNSNNNLKESFFSKYNKLDINQNNRKINEPYKKEQKCISAFDSMLANNNKNNSEELNNKQNINKGNIYNQKINIKNDDTPSSGSTLAYSKKYNSNSINNQNMTEDHNNKFRMGLLSAFPNSNNNNNIIIPLLPIQRPLSNFNLGGGQLWENIDNINKNTINSIKIEQNSKHTNINKKIINNNINIIDKNRICNDMRHKIGTAPSQKREFNYFSNNDKEKNMINKNYSNIFNNISTYGPKFHQIKIDKSLMNNKLSDSLNKNIFLNYMSLEQNKLPKIKNNHYNEIKKLSNLRNNSTKN